MSTGRSIPIVGQTRDGWQPDRRWLGMLLCSLSAVITLACVAWLMGWVLFSDAVDKIGHHVS